MMHISVLNAHNNSPLASGVRLTQRAKCEESKKVGRFRHDTRPRHWIRSQGHHHRIYLWLFDLVYHNEVDGPTSKWSLSCCLVPCLAETTGPVTLTANASNSRGNSKTDAEVLIEGNPIQRAVSRSSGCIVAYGAVEARNDCKMRVTRQSGRQASSVRRAIADQSFFLRLCLRPRSSHHDAYLDDHQSRFCLAHRTSPVASRSISVCHAAWRLPNSESRSRMSLITDLSINRISKIVTLPL
jgi:hypothetical protein